MATVLAAAFALLGGLYSGAQFWLGKSVLRRKPHFIAYYVLERIILDLLFLLVIMVVFPDGLVFAASGLVVTAIVLAVLGIRWK